MNKKADSEEKEEFLDRLKKAIKYKKITHPDITDDEIAEFLGVSRPTFTNYKSGRRGMKIIHLRKFCDFTDVNERWLVSNKGKMEADYVEKLEAVVRDHIKDLESSISTKI